jgi:urease accessory protein UreE
VRDFNLMFARRKFKGSLETIDITKALTLRADGGVAAFHLVRGEAKGIAEGDTLIMQDDETVEIAAATEGAIGILARLHTTTRF